MTSNPLPSPPADLGPRGKRAWSHALHAMDEGGYLELPTDLLCVESYCRLLDEVASVGDLVRRLGPDYIIGGLDGGEPTTTGRLLEKYRAEVLEMAAELGLTPGSRRDIRSALRRRPLDPGETAKRKALADALLRIQAAIKADVEAEGK